MNPVNLTQFDSVLFVQHSCFIQRNGYWTPVTMYLHHLWLEAIDRHFHPTNHEKLSNSWINVCHWGSRCEAFQPSNLRAVHWMAESETGPITLT